MIVPQHLHLAPADRYRDGLLTGVGIYVEGRAQHPGFYASGVNDERMICSMPDVEPGFPGKENLPLGAIELIRVFQGAIAVEPDLGAIRQDEEFLFRYFRKLLGEGPVVQR